MISSVSAQLKIGYILSERIRTEFEDFKEAEAQLQLDKLKSLVKQAAPQPQGGGGGGGGEEVLFEDVEKTKEVGTYYCGKGRPRKTDKRDENGKLIIQKVVRK